MIRAIVFDFDGLILDTEMPIFRSWAETCSDHGIELDLRSWQTIVGTDGHDPAEALERRVEHRPDWQCVLDRRRRRRDELQALESIRPGVVAWLDEIQQLAIPVGIASSSPRAWVEGHLSRLGLIDRFVCIRCCDDVGVAKPSPASYLAVIEHFGVEGSEAVAIEDSLHGVTAAKQAGMWCIVVPNAITRDMDFSAADLVVDSLADVALSEALSQFGSASR